MLNLNSFVVVVYVMKNYCQRFIYATPNTQIPPIRQDIRIKRAYLVFKVGSINVANLRSWLKTNTSYSQFSVHLKMSQF